MKKPEKSMPLPVLCIASEPHLASLMKAEQTLRKPHTRKSILFSRKSPEEKTQTLNF